MPVPGRDPYGLRPGGGTLPEGVVRCGHRRMCSARVVYRDMGQMALYQTGAGRGLGGKRGCSILVRLGRSWMGGSGRVVLEGVCCSNLL